MGDGIGGEATASAPAPAADEPSASCAEAADAAPPDVEALKLSLLQGFLMDLVRPVPALAGPPLIRARAHAALVLTLAPP